MKSDCRYENYASVKLANNRPHYCAIMSNRCSEYGRIAKRGGLLFLVATTTGEIAPSRVIDDFIDHLPFICESF